MSDPGPCVRRAAPQEAETISQLIITTLFRSNATDYPHAVLVRIAEVNAPQRILSNMLTRSILVAPSPKGDLMGTASVEGAWLKALFVHPDAQRQGIGRALLDASMEIAAEEGHAIMQLQSSLTALAFYRAAGFEDLREIIDGDDRTVLMHRKLP